ncbi:unnamed protein product [Candidula unifasciata]|uniref:Autophagy-related protein 2 n=1 Tax=Candidula unifasciata TaxID=100452 RepID=A0A8S3ZH99_9EUPU|nr:unnamed protein product [Candidula unifasciata]
MLTFDVNSFTEASNVYDPKIVFNVDRPRLPQSALSLTVDCSQKRMRHKEPPVVKLSLDFGKLTSEVDITIIDRLTNLINPDLSGGSGTSVGTQLVDDAYGHVDEAMKDEQSGTKIHPSVQVKATHATLRVRFPIPDLREDPPAQAREWWRRHLHKEILVLEMEAPEAMTNIRPDEPLQLALQVFKISAYLQEDINTNPVLFGEVKVEDPKATPYDGHHFNWPRFVVCWSNKSNSVLEAGEAGESDNSAHSIDSYLDSSLLKKESGPFSQKKSMYARDDLSFSEQQTAPVNDEMVMPGNARELKHFREECMGRTSMSIEVTAPCVLAYMHSREFLELLYNRFNNDLLMWEPRPPRSRSYLSSLIPSSTDLNVMHMFRHRYGDFPSTVETEASDSDDDESMLYSVHEQHGSPADGKQTSPKLLNKMCFSLSIGRGKLLAVIPHVEQSPKADLHAELLITLKDGLLFSVNQHGGDPDLKYLCLQVNNVQMYHNGCVMLPVPVGTLDHIRDKIPQHLNPRICRSDRWVSDKVQGLAGYGIDSPDMLTLVVKTKLDTLNNLKNFTVAVRVDGATLRHEMHRTGESWVSQAIDLLDLKDFPIQGYTLPKIMTELHLQIDHCGVDYRPLHLPVWSFLTVEHFSVCTNIIAESLFSQIRLQLDDTALFLSNKCDRDKEREQRLCQDRHKEVNLFKDYVCVAEMDQFKIWLQFCYDKSTKQRCPKSDLRFKVNELNLRTCADSTRALQDLIQYICGDGDLLDDVEADDITPTMSDSDRQFFPSEDVEGRQEPSPVLHVPTITPEQEASVVSALEDAMTECPEPATPQKTKKKKKDGKMTNVYFQCNKENINFETQHRHQAPLQITVFDGSDSSTPDEEGQDNKDTEEFEFIDCHFKEITNIQGSHEVHMLTNGPIEVEENFIPKPTSSYDHLKAPDKFPDPEHQYTLREMSVVWHIYGGSDFSHPRRGSSGRPGFSKGLPSPREQRKLSETGGRHGWRRKGGDCRDHDVKLELDLNKIRFRYDVYTATAKQSSRFKLLVNNIELRDKVKASDINKFLVRLVDKENPEQTSAYMLMFSGVFIRPEHLPFREDCEVKAFCLPIQLNVDQNTLNFLRKFVTQVTEPDRDLTSGSGSAGGRSSPQGGRASPLGGRGSPRHSLSNTEPIMRIGEPLTKESSMDETELLMKFEDFSNQQSQYLQARLNEKDNPELPQENLPVFIKSFVLISDVTIKLAYQGKGCDMDSGPVGLMLGLISLNGSVITLRKLHLQKGLLGWNKLLMYIANEWLKDIRLNQIHSILKGFGSFSILCQIVQGLTDLVRLPIEQYQKDRRIIRGLQRGANSFTLNTIMAILELTNKVVGSIQYCAELGYDMLSPGPSVKRRKQLRHRTRQPRTTAEGAKAALQLVTEGVKESASHLSAVVSEESAHKGYVGIVGGSLRNATPELFLKPLALLAEAGTNIVQGARNEVDPSVMKEEEDRWKQA